MAATRLGARAPPPLTSRATAASSRASPVMSSFAVPPSIVVRIGDPTTIAVPRSVAGPIPNGRPMHQPLTRARASQPRFTNGERRSLPNATIPTAWISDPFEGWNGVSGS